MAAKKMKFRGQLHFPIAMGGAATFDKERMKNYFDNNEIGRGGWYPMGASQTWHNGVHLDAARGTPVRSVARGRIVAARLGKDYTAGKYPFGSPRFVLVKHALSLIEDPAEKDIDKWEPRDVEFFSLYMHLDWQSSQMNDVPWLGSFSPFIDAEDPPSGTLAKVNVAEDEEIRADDAGRKKKKIGLNYREAPTENKHGKVGKWTPGKRVGVLHQGTIVERCAGRMGNYQEVNVPSLRLKSVWVYDEGHRLVDVPRFAEQVRALRDGGCVALDYPIESGEVIGHAGLIEPAHVYDPDYLATHGVHFEVFSGENLIADDDRKNWQLIQDETEDDVICEYGALQGTVPAELFDTLKRLAWDSTRFDALDEVCAAHGALSPAERAALRACVTYNTSFWAIDWQQMVTKNAAWAKQFDFPDELQEAANRYAWWRECESKGVDLPARNGGKALVYHYHPIAVMEYIAARVPVPPIFYVTRDGEEYAVQRPGDIKTTDKGGESVFVYEYSKQAWSLGYGFQKGIVSVGDTNIYAMLIDPASTPGIPSLDDTDKRIWASLWHSEGGLEAVNSWDTAFLSFGPMQQTMGKKKEKGELQGALHYIKKHAPELFQKFFGRYELEVVEVDDKEGKLVYGYAALNGETLRTADKKEIFRDFIWSYRCVKAMENLDFRRHFLAHGFNRLEIVRGLEHKFSGESLKVRDIYKTELAQALILDAHINVPSLIDEIWAGAVKKVLGDGIIDVSKITLENEYAMIKEIIHRRNESGMTDSAPRATYIVRCVVGLDDALAKKIGYENFDEIKKSSKNPAKIYKSFLNHTR